MRIGPWLQPTSPEFDSPFPLVWKDEFYNALCEYINKQYHVNAVEVTGVYDHAWSYENSLGGCDHEYECDIYYKTENSNIVVSITYQGRFSDLIESISS